MKFHKIDLITQQLYNKTDSLTPQHYNKLPTNS